MKSLFCVQILWAIFIALFLCYMEDMGSWGKTKWSFEKRKLSFEIGWKHLTTPLLHDLLLCMYELIFFYVECIHTQVLTSHHVSQWINNLKEILFWIEELDLSSLLFTWGLPSQRFPQSWSSSLPLCPHPPHPWISMKISMKIIPTVWSNRSGIK